MRKGLIAVIAILLLLFGVNGYIYALNETKSIVEINELKQEIEKQKAEIMLQNAEMKQLENKIKEYQEVMKLKADWAEKAEYGIFKSIEDYRLFDPKYTPYKLQQSAITDKRGFRRQGEYYFIAIGTGWGFVEGDKVLVVLSTGYSFKAIMGDRKSDAHTDPETHKATITNSKGEEGDKSVVEFIVDVDKIKKYIGNTGTVSTLPEFKGAVVGIYKLD